MKLAEKTAIITGGSHGMGRAMAEKFVSEGARVTITGRSQERLDEAREDIQAKTGQDVLTVAMDVRDAEGIQTMITKTKDTYGDIDILVNNAAGNFLCRSEDLSANGWQSVIDICLNGTWHCSQAVGQEMIAQGHGGVMLNMIATYAWTGAPYVVHSAAAKGGVLALTKSLAIEWGKYGIRMNCIAPGPIENTGGSERLFADEQAIEQIIKQNPLRTTGELTDISEAAAFLVSPESKYINGDCMTIDGGQWMNGQFFG